MRILEIVDVENWAIGKLAKVIQEENPHHKIEILAIHPKDYRNNPENWNGIFSAKVNEFNPDIIHFHYWDTAQSLSALDICKDRKKILTHHNQKNLLSHKWENIDRLVVHTQKAKNILEEAGYWNVDVIQHGIDIEKYKFNDEYDYDNRLIGYIGRIVPWKGLYEILSVAKDLNTEVLMMGRIDKGDYWAKCQEFDEQMDIRFDTPEDRKVEVIHEMAVYVGNSEDNIEEGTLGLLEAMACGIPVITTPAGEANDIIKDKVNGLLINFNDKENLKFALETFYKMSKEEKEKMRVNAWNTVRQLSKQIMGRKYEKTYYSLFNPNDLVSVIIPSCKRSDTIINVLNAYTRQAGKNPIELIVAVDSGFDLDYEEKLLEWRKNNDIPIKWFYTGNEGYGLAQARNEAVFKAKGNYLIFNDDRFIPESNAVNVFVNRIKEIKDKIVVWGDKGAGKRDFIENFFIIRKKHLLDVGMFNERINEYGGQSQEFRDRLIRNDFVRIYDNNAIATTQFGTHNKSKKRYELFRMKQKLWDLLN